MRSIADVYRAGFRDFDMGFGSFWQKEPTSGIVICRKKDQGVFGKLPGLFTHTDAHDYLLQSVCRENYDPVAASQAPPELVTKRIGAMQGWVRLTVSSLC
jgi:hypothetical protein